MYSIWSKLHSKSNDRFTGFSSAVFFPPRQTRVEVFLSSDHLAFSRYDGHDMSALLDCGKWLFSFYTGKAHDTWGETNGTNILPRVKDGHLRRRIDKQLFGSTYIVSWDSVSPISVHYWTSALSWGTFRTVYFLDEQSNLAFSLPFTPLKQQGSREWASNRHPGESLKREWKKPSPTLPPTNPRYLCPRK